MNKDKYFDLAFKVALPLLITASIIKLTCYYSQFNLPILTLLDTSEFVNLFLSDLTQFLLFFLPAITLIPLEDRIPCRQVVIHFLLIILLVTINYLNHSIEHPLLEGMYISMVSIFATGIFFRGSFINLVDSPQKLPKSIGMRIYMYITFVIFVVATLSAWFGYSKANQVKDKLLYFGTSIKLKDTTLTSDSNYYFLGKSNHYLFFFDAKENVSSAIPIEQVEKMNFKNGDMKFSLQSSKEDTSTGPHPYFMP